MAQALDHLLDIHGDQRLVFDDEDIGSDLAGNLVARLDEKFGESLVSDAEDFGGFSLAEAFDRNQQEGLARQRRKRIKVGSCTLFPACRLIALRNADCDGCEEFGENLVERDAILGTLREDRRICDDRLEHRRHHGIAAVLGTGDSAGKPAQIRKMRRDSGGQTHDKRLPRMASLHCNR
jgi:hypothetical protein